jgi:hypothetical protein
MKFKNLPKRKEIYEVVPPSYSIHQTPTTSFYKTLEHKERVIKEMMEREWRI